MKVEYKLEGVDHVMGLLRALPAEVVSKSGGPVKTALRKGAMVILPRLQANLRAAIADTSDQPDIQQSTGLLLKAARVTRGKAPADGKGERYLVRFSRLKYDRAGKTVTTLKTAQLLEYGSEKQPPRPYIRPAFASEARHSIEVTRRELLAALDRVVRRLARGKAR